MKFFIKHTLVLIESGNISKKYASFGMDIQRRFNVLCLCCKENDGLNCCIKQLSELDLVLFMCETEKPIVRSSITAGEHMWYNIVRFLPY